VVDRKAGGGSSAETRLTERGGAFLLAYQLFEDSVLSHAQVEFEHLFEARGLVKGEYRRAAHRSCTSDKELKWHARFFKL
jgi:molybdenum-dependent DNA-binding transcriptional regulator ModE